jgi:hypothetical protein
MNFVVMVDFDETWHKVPLFYRYTLYVPFTLNIFVLRPTEHSHEWPRQASVDLSDFNRMTNVITAN